MPFLFGSYLTVETGKMGLSIIEGRLSMKKSDYKGVTIYFVRHGETYLNYYGRMQGWSNAPLTPDGAEVVRKSGRGLSDIQFDAIYTSDLMRTQDTANLLLEENKETDPDKKFVLMPEFREVFFGSFEGEKGHVAYQKVAEELGFESSKELFNKTKVPERMRGFKAADEFHDAEDFMEFWSRVERGLLKIVEKHKFEGDTILLVAHGQTIRYILQSLVPELTEPEGLLNASVSVAHYHGGKFELDRYGDVSHFKDE